MAAVNGPPGPVYGRTIFAMTGPPTAMMTEQVSPELGRSNEELPSSYSLEAVGKESQEELDMLQDQDGQNYIEVTCGDATGWTLFRKANA